MTERDDKSTKATSSLVRIVEVVKSTNILMGAISNTITVLHHVIPYILGAGTFFSILILTVDARFQKSSNITYTLISSFSVIGWASALYYFVRYRIKCRRLDEHLLRSNSTRAIADVFHDLARYHAECDKLLFDLFLEDIAHPAPPQEAIEKSLGLVEKNIDDVLDFACKVFHQHTGYACATCIKLIIADREQPHISILDLRVGTLRRDSGTRFKRSSFDKTRIDYVRDNTADIHIVTPTKDNEYRNDVWACDDLIELNKNDRYYNARGSWPDDYNATLVCGILNLHKEDNIHWRGFFCIDNKDGGFNNEIAKDYARQFAARLAIMMYRLDLLEEWRNLLYDTSRDSLPPGNKPLRRG